MTARKIKGIIFTVATLLAIALLVWGFRRPPGVAILYLGNRQTPLPDGPRPLFLITNPTSYRITWTMMAPEFHLDSGWTRSSLVAAGPGGKIRPVRFGGEPLEPGGGFQIYGIAPTNVEYRYPLLWGLDPALARARPKWKQAVDGWLDGMGLPPVFLPNGIVRSPVIPAQSSTNKAKP